MNEYGIDVQTLAAGSPPPAAAAPRARRRPMGGAEDPRWRALVRRALGGGGNSTCAGNWQNATACMDSSFRDALVTSAYETWTGRLHSGPYVSWQCVPPPRPPSATARP